MPESHDYFQMIGGAAATLVGLLFVAVSLNANIIFDAANPHSRRIAEQSFQSYMAVLIVSLFQLFPGITNQVLATELIAMPAVYIGWTLLRIFARGFGSIRNASSVPVLRRYIFTLLGFGELIYAGFQILADKRDDGIVAVGVLLLLVSATVVAWELLVKLGADKHAGRPK
jgi:hypothetical protein